MELSANPGHWEWLSPLLYETYSDLRYDYPDAALQFEFWGDVDLTPGKIVYIDISGVPDEPVKPVDFIYPTVTPQAVRPDSTFEWDVDRNDGDMITLGISPSEYEGEDLYFECPVSMNTTSWEPGPLPVGSNLSLFVSVSNVKDWGKGKPAYPIMSSSGDTFEFGLMVEYFNEMSLIVAQVDIVTETITNKSKSIECHIWPLDGFDVRDIYQPSIYLFDTPVLVDGIAPSSISINSKEQMLVVKFPVSQLDPLVPGILDLTVWGEVGDLSDPDFPDYFFMHTEPIEVVKKGGKPN